MVLIAGVAVCLVVVLLKTPGPEVGVERGGAWVSLPEQADLEGHRSTIEHRKACWVFRQLAHHQRLLYSELEVCKRQARHRS